MINAQMPKSLFAKRKRLIVRFLRAFFIGVLDWIGMNLPQQNRTIHM